MRDGDEVRKSIEAVRRALDALAASAERNEPPGEALRDLARAVDDLRRSIWAVLTAEHTGDYPAYVGRVRVRRATETCEDVLAELLAGTLPRSTPGLEVLRATLRELVDTCGKARPCTG